MIVERKARKGEYYTMPTLGIPITGSRQLSNGFLPRRKNRSVHDDYKEDPLLVAANAAEGTIVWGKCIPVSHWSLGLDSRY